MAKKPAATPFTAILSEVFRSDTTDPGHAWLGMEPTFSSKKSVKLWAKLSQTEEMEDQFFEHPYILKKEKAVAQAMLKKYRAARERGEPWCLFDTVERRRDLDQWQVRRQNLDFRCDGDDNVFTVRFGLDPEVFEFSIKPVPVQWLYDARFVRFLQEIVWDVPQELGLRSSIEHGGCQFSLSAKTFMGGSLLCDQLADRLNHPELCSFLFDYPNCDDRCYRATPRRREAFLRIVEQYWAGAFHPRAIGPLTVENALLDYGFAPAAQPPPGLMGSHGPIGNRQEIFQTNFAFGRAVRLLAQNTHPGYWQGAHPDSMGYRPDQIMRYSEGNLNRLRIRGEYHVKSGEVLEPDAVPPLSAPLAHTMLYNEASVEVRAQFGRTSARDFVEAVLLDVHRAQYLQDHPGVRLEKTLLQDQLLADAEATLIRHGRRARLEELRLEAKGINAESSGGRINSDFIEPEALFWEAFYALPQREQALIAREVLTGFIARVGESSAYDPRRHRKPGSPGWLDTVDSDVMEWHRHRVLPLLWPLLGSQPDLIAGPEHAAIRTELSRYRLDPERYLTRRPPWGFREDPEPWLPPKA